MKTVCRIFAEIGFLLEKIRQGEYLRALHPPLCSGPEIAGKRREDDSNARSASEVGFNFMVSETIRNAL